MLAVVPLFFRNHLESLFWHEAAGRSQIFQLTRLLASLQQVRQVVLLAPGPGWEKAASDKVVVVTADLSPAPAPDAGQAHPLPIADPRLLPVFRQRAADPAEPLLCVDFRNVFLTRDLLLEAIAAYDQSGGKPLVATRKPLDHPCQFKRYLGVVEVGRAHIGGTENAPGGRCGPFSGADPRSQGCLIKDVGICAEGQTPSGSQSRRYRLHFPQAKGRERVSAVLQAFGPHADQVPAAVETPLNEANSHEVQLDLVPEETEGVMFCLLQQVDSGVYDFSIPVEPLDRLWYFNKASIAIKTTDGTQILGRQDFPQLFELDGSLAIARSGELPQVRELLEQGRVAGFPLTRCPIDIDHERDIPLAQALLQLAAKELSLRTIKRNS